MRISACYIVKNEEKNIGISIASLQGIYDELIVVDTGSTDNTVAIASEYGAEIYSVKWQNDFAKARNYALSKATGDWIIFLDADEYYDCFVSIRQYLHDLGKEYPDKEAVLIPLYDAYQPQNPPLHVVRIFRNRPDMRYRGTIHEQLFKERGKMQYVIADKMVFMHTGYHPRNMEKKSKRNLQLLLAEVERNGERDDYYYYIAECYFGLQEYEKALTNIRKAIASPVRHYREEANYYHILLESMRQCKYPGEEMAIAAEKAIRKFPDMPEFYGEQGIILSSIGRYDEAYKMLWKCIEKYEFTNFQSQEYSYFNPEIMGIIYARLAKIALLKNKHEVAKLATCCADKISQGKWGIEEKEELRQVIEAGHKQNVVICIPIYKKELSPFEKASLMRLNQVLGRYPRVFIAPESLRFDYQEYGTDINVERFPNYFFNNVSSYSSLMLNIDFYKRFAQYKYMLIYQTDAFVFSDRLEQFCNMDYDYIGAPISRFEPAWHAIDARIGNGGLSLRKVSAAIRMLKQWDDILQDSRPFSNWFTQWEDLFWGYCGRREDLAFKVPSVKLALEFAIQADVAHAHKRMKKGWRPFGCHGWYTLNYDFWQKIIEGYGFDFSKLPNPNRVAYPRIKDYLITRQTVNMRILWGVYAKQGIKKAVHLIEHWLKQYPNGHAGWYHNMEELVCMWRAVAIDKRYSKSWQELCLRKLAEGIKRGVFRKNFYPMIWNLLVTMIPHLREYDYAEMKELIVEIEFGWWKFWTGNVHYQKQSTSTSKKRIIALVTATDENELLESFIRHTLTFVDVIIIDERFATDTVKDILHKMEAEGLPLIIHQKALNCEEFTGDVDYILSLEVNDFILPQKSNGNIRTILENLPAKQAYAIDTGFFAPYQPYANQDKFLLARPLVRLDRIPVQTKMINVSNDNQQIVELVKELYVARFGQIDTEDLNYGIIPANMELVDIRPYIINHQLNYADM